MIRKAFTPHTPAPEPQSGKPEISGEQWLGQKPGAQNANARRRLWERLNPLHQKQLRLFAHAFVLRQSSGKLPEHVRARLHAAMEELERLAGRVERLLAELGARRQPPAE